MPTKLPFDFPHNCHCQTWKIWLHSRIKVICFLTGIEISCCIDKSHFLSFSEHWQEGTPIIHSLGQWQTLPKNITYHNQASFPSDFNMLILSFCPSYSYPLPSSPIKIMDGHGSELDHLTCLLRNLYAGQEATVRAAHGTTDWFQIGKGVHQGCILSPCLFNLRAQYIMRNAGLEEAQARIKIAGRNINNLDMQMTPPLWQRVKRN